ncbi:MAG: hypothetical protein JWN18_430 [Parcubacteria group bacterium]|nr:hypothetical protein [Parcubacteria group bacterium]
MRLEDIARMPAQTHMPHEIQRLQREAPRYVRAIIEKTKTFPKVKSIDELEPGSIELLEGGVASALYSVRNLDELVVIKLRKDGIEAERESLEAWAKEGVRIPTIRHQGVVPKSLEKAKIKYLLLDFIVNKKGERASTGVAFLRKNPNRARQMGQVLGRTLARMHRAKSKRSFGEFADTVGKSKTPIRTWNKYLLGYVRLHHTYLQRLGISRRLLRQLMRSIEKIRFSSRGIYVHGDYSLRNVMVESSKPLKIVVFDPNPLIGDPSWDIAILFNNRDYRRKRYEWDPTVPHYREAYRIEERFFDGFWKSYRLATRKNISLDKIRIAQLIQTIIHLQAEEHKTYQSKAMNELEVRVRREVLFERFGSLDLDH